MHILLENRYHNKDIIDITITVLLLSNKRMYVKF